MRSRFLLTCIVAAALLAAARAADSTEDEDDVQVSSVPAGMETATPEPTPEEPITAVLELTDENFDDVISGDVPVLVQFQAHWCGVCKTIRKEYQRAAEIAVNTSLPVIIARIDGSKFKEEISDRYEVTTLPAFILFRGGGSYESFPLLTTGEGYIAGLDKLLDWGLDFRPVKEFATEDVEEVAAWVFWRGTSDGKMQTTSVLYTPPGLVGAAATAAQELDEAFTAVSKELLRFSNLRFAQVTSLDVLETFGIPTDCATVVTYTDHDEGRAEYAGAATAAALQDFIIRRDVPLVTSIWHKNLQTFRKRVDTLALLFVSEAQHDDPATMARLKHKVLSVLTDFEAKGVVKRGEFTMGIVNSKKYGSWMTPFLLDKARIPSLALENTTTHEAFAAPDFVLEACSGPIPDDMEPSPLLPAPLLAKINAARGRGGLESVEVAADGSSRDSSSGFQHKLDEQPLTWVDVPTAIIAAWLDKYFSGQLRPVGKVE